MDRQQQQKKKNRALGYLLLVILSINIDLRHAHAHLSQVQSSAYFTYNQPPAINYHLTRLFECPLFPNIHTSHIRFGDVEYRSINFTSPGQSPDSDRRMFNPTILPLPHWSTEAKYLLVSRVVTSGLHQESLICLASLCHPIKYWGGKQIPPDEEVCKPDDPEILGPRGGLRCHTPPIRVNIPPTPAEKCDGVWTPFPDIPGFHDPRIFWSGKGEPLIVVNSASRYGCVGLWIVDLRTLYPELDHVMRRKGKKRPQSLPPMSYSHLTELTRNPRGSRNSIEKNWIMFFPNHDESFVQYDLFPHISMTSPKKSSTSLKSRDLRWNSTMPVSSHSSTIISGRTFAKLIGNGFTTPNLTSPFESNCFTNQIYQNISQGHTSDFTNHLNHTGHWHQSTNSLRLILCTRSEVKRGECPSNPNETIKDGRSVHFAIVHRKFSNDWDLPMRYERYVVVWESRAPFRVVAVSEWPWLVDEEIARPWTEDENREGDGSDHITSITEEGVNSNTPSSKSKDRSSRSQRQHEPRVIMTNSSELHNTKWANKTFHSNNDEFFQNYKKTRPPTKQTTTYFTYTPSIAWAWRPPESNLFQSRLGTDMESENHSPNTDQDSISSEINDHDTHRHQNKNNPKTDPDEESHKTRQDENSQNDDEEGDIDHLASLGTGYLDDEILVGIGLDDIDSAFVKIRVDRLLVCLRLCPGVLVS